MLTGRRQRQPQTSGPRLYLPQPLQRPPLLLQKEALRAEVHLAPALGAVLQLCQSSQPRSQGLKACPAHREDSFLGAPSLTQSQLELSTAKDEPTCSLLDSFAKFAMASATGQTGGHESELVDVVALWSLPGWDGRRGEAHRETLGSHRGMGDAERTRGFPWRQSGAPCAEAETLALPQHLQHRGTLARDAFLSVRSEAANRWLWLTHCPTVSMVGTFLHVEVSSPRNRQRRSGAADAPTPCCLT
ncbi:hypothetical protein P7K49_010052 [Saguinus oedipus]|uniref:Uncharacterized protein n=1 Tax=Saguinus oedipus TaxID=9490 RepID=A0ABQ9VLP8_SAGOE|nr:hypothetical protein P7K49_010052 [Saguinus oedipus]